MRKPGRTYYACDCGAGASPRCVPGDDDGAPGTSPSRPWRTYQRLRDAFGRVQPGDTVAFCKGGSFDVGAGGPWLNYQCRASKPCLIRDYAPPWGGGSERRPILRSSGRNVFDFGNPGDARHKEGVRIINLRLESGGGGWGFFFFNDVDDVSVCNVEIDGFEVGVHVGGANPPERGSDGLNERIEIVGSRILNCSGNGFLGACNGCVVRDSYLWNNGGDSILLHGIYFGGKGSNERIVNNVIHASGADGKSRCNGAVVVVHGVHAGMVIEGNQIIAYPGHAGEACWGLSVSAGYGESERFRDLVIRGNVVKNAGNTPVSVTAAPDALIENNVVIAENPWETVGIEAPLQVRRAEGDATGRQDEVMHHATVRNNTVYFGPSASGRGLHVGVEGTGHVVANNAVFFAGASRSWSCFQLELPASAYELVDGNLCWYPRSPGAWEMSTGARDLAAWRRARPSFDRHSIQADPLFTRPPDDLSPGPRSPLVGRGSLSGPSRRDLTGKPRDARPDIGAYER